MKTDCSVRRPSNVANSNPRVRGTRQPSRGTRRRPQEYRQRRVAERRQSPCPARSRRGARRAYAMRRSAASACAVLDESSRWREGACEIEINLALRREGQVLLFGGGRLREKAGEVALRLGRAQLGRTAQHPARRRAAVRPGCPGGRAASARSGCSSDRRGAAFVGRVRPPRPPRLLLLESPGIRLLEGLLAPELGPRRAGSRAGQSGGRPRRA